MAGPRRLWFRITGVVLLVAAALGWTVGAAYLVALGIFVASDTRCGAAVHNPRVDMAGGWIVIATVTLWSAPFVVCAIRFHNVVVIALAMAVVCVSVFVVAYMFATPQSFCW